MKKLLYKVVMVLLMTQNATAEVFQWIDAKGQRHFSDYPQPNSTRLKINVGYTYYQLKKVYDGDTILLNDGRKVRLLGINTPEVEGRNKSLEAGGNEAREWLIQQLSGKELRLETDVEKQDKYGRYLAHVFSRDNRHINLELVRNGLAQVTIHPPNLKYSRELVAAQRDAEKKQLRLWHDSDYQPKSVNSLNAHNYKGWQRITGRVQRIEEGRKYHYLLLSDTVRLKIERQWMDLFPDLSALIGQQIEARGWINRQGQRYFLSVLHPSSIIKQDYYE